MTLRFCPRCRAEVEDTGGYCLLGHPFPVIEPDPIADLRAEVDQALAKVKLDLAAVANAARVEVPATTTRFGVYEDLASSTETAGPLDGDDQAVVEDLAASRRDYWSQLRTDETTVERNDPILAFSPSPRMEWGPTRRGRPKRDKQ